MSREPEERPATLATVLSGATALLNGESGASKTFIGGLIAGALVGAAVAGGSLMRSRVTSRPESRSTPGR